MTQKIYLKLLNINVNVDIWKQPWLLTCLFARFLCIARPSSACAGPALLDAALPQSVVGNLNTKKYSALSSIQAAKTVIPVIPDMANLIFNRNAKYSTWGCRNQPELWRLLDSSSMNLLLYSYISWRLGHSVNECHLHLSTWKVQYVTTLYILDHFPPLIPPQTTWF